MKIAFAAALLVVLALAMTLIDAQRAPRFVRPDMWRLDEHTSVDLVRDTRTSRCYAVYRWTHTHYNAAVTTLGEVDCP